VAEVAEVAAEVAEEEPAGLIHHHLSVVLVVVVEAEEEAEEAEEAEGQGVLL
jgi:hypothetical protein